MTTNGAICVWVPVELVQRIEKYWTIDPHDYAFIEALTELLSISDGTGSFCPQWSKEEFDRILRDSMKERDAEIARMTTERDNWIDRFTSEINAHIALREEFVKVINIIKDACDRDWKDEYPEQVATITANSIYWRNEEINKLRGQRAQMRDLLRQFTDFSAYPDSEDADGTCYYCGERDKHNPKCCYSRALAVLDGSAETLGGME